VLGVCIDFENKLSFQKDDDDAEWDWSQFTSRSLDMLRMSPRGCLYSACGSGSVLFC